MKSILRKFVWAPALLAGVALSAVSAKADTNIKVPFDFTVSGKVCPAGTYTVRHAKLGNFVTLERRGSSDVMTWVVGPGDSDPTGRKVALRFHDLGHTHVLESIRYGSLSTPKLDKNASENERATDRLTGGR